MTFADDLNRTLRESADRMDQHVLYGNSGPTVDTSAEPTFTVTKWPAYLMLSVDQQLDAGLITEEQARAQGWTPYVQVPVPWYRRLHWRWQAWRERAGRKIGGWIAGVDLSERDEDW